VNRSRISRLAASVLVLQLAFAPMTSAFAQSGSAANTYSATQLDGQTAVERAVGKCVLVVAGGAVLGALLGGHNAGRGAAIGAAVGGGACAAMLTIASQQDKARMRQLELQAANSGEKVTDSWETSDHHTVTATVTPSPIVEVSDRKSGGELKCRHLNSAINDQDSRDTVCLQGDTWVTFAKLQAQGVVTAADMIT
jgi:hypothetical protein